MNTIFLNPNLIEMIKISHSKKHDIEWRQATTRRTFWYWFGLIPRKYEEGFYYPGMHNCFTEKELNTDGRIVIGKEVYERAYAYVHYNRGGKAIYFNTPAEVDAFISKMEKIGILVKWQEK